MKQSQIKKHFIRCKVDGCRHKFTSVRCINSHLKIKHGFKIHDIGRNLSYYKEFNYCRLPWKWLSERYKKLVLLMKTGWKCWKCGFNERRKNGGVVLEMDHIDANYLNNSKENLRILCPNCHSLTENFGNWGGGIIKDKTSRPKTKRTDIIQKFKVSKRTLTQLIWNYGMAKTAIMFGVSHTSIKRRVMKYKIPVPDGRKRMYFRREKYKEIFGKELENIKPISSEVER